MKILRNHRDVFEKILIFKKLDAKLEIDAKNDAKKMQKIKRTPNPVFRGLFGIETRMATQKCRQFQELPFQEMSRKKLK